MTRSANSQNGSPFPAFPKGGRIRRLVVGATWTEFDPLTVDLYRIHVPVTSSGRVIYTSTTDVSDLVEGAAVTDAHRDIAPTYYPGTWHECVDRSSTGTPRFFFALDGAGAGDTAALLLEAAAQ